MRRLGLRTTVAALAAATTFAAGASSAAAHPCDPKPVLQVPSRDLRDALGVLRRPAATLDRPPRDIREGDGRPMVNAIRRVPLAVGGWVWLVPLYDISDRVSVTDACLRALPRRFRARLRRLRHLSRGIPRQEGFAILPYAADGESLGTATGPSSGVREGMFVHETGVDGDRRTRVTGVAPDGVASVRVRLVRPYAGGHDPRQVVTGPVTDNAFAVLFDVRFDGEVEGDVTWLDAAGAVVAKP